MTGIDVNRFMGMGVWLLTVLAFFFMLFTGSRYREYWLRYRSEILLLASFLALHLLSLLLNLNVYPDFKSLVFYGLAPLAVFSLLVMAWGLFKGGEPGKYVLIAPVMFLLIHCFAVGQFLNYELFRPITSHTLAADIMHPGYITSVFPHHTIYGTIAAVNIIYGLNLLLRACLSRVEKHLWFLIIPLALVGGALSHSRNFLWTLGFGLLALGFFWGRRKLGVWLAIMVFAVVAFHAVAYQSPNIQRQYGRALPYLGKLEKPSEIEMTDFIPQFSAKGLTGRPQLWHRAIGLWQESPILGKGPGSFNLTGANLHSRQFNVHCFYLQILLDTGLVGAFVLLLLICSLLRHAKSANTLPVLIAVMASLVFDNFLDHSMAWSILMAWYLQPLPVNQNLKL